MSLGLGVGTLVLQTLGVLAAIGLIAALLAVPGAHLRALTVAAVSALAAALSLSGTPAAFSFLNGQRHAGVGGPAAREQCLLETGAGGIVPFLDWLKLRIPADGRYWLASNPRLVDAPGGFDPLCVAFQLLPRLPLPSDAGAGWIIYTGVVTPAVRARIAARDPAVEVFSPGFVLVREATG